MGKRNHQGFMLIETLLVSVFIASTLIFLYIQFQKVRDSYDVTFSYNTIDGVYSSKVLLEYLQENGIANMSNALKSNSITQIEVSTCPGAYLTNTTFCNRLVENLNIRKAYYVSSDVTNFRNKMKSLGLSNKFQTFIRSMKDSDGIGYRLVIEYNDDTYATILARNNNVSSESVF